MAELATPAAAEISTISAGSDNKPTKPERPDEEQYKTELAKKEKALTAAVNNIKAKQALLNEAKGSADSPSGERKKVLRDQLAAKRDSQAADKKARQTELDKIKALDTQRKAKITDLRNSKGNLPFKSVEDVDKEIARLEAQVDSGKMKLVDEKKALSDVSNYRKQKKLFAGFDDKQKEVDAINAQIAEIKAGMQKGEGKGEQDEYSNIKAELDSINETESQRRGGLNKIRDELRDARAHQEQQWQVLKDLKDSYWKQKKAHMDYEREAKKIFAQKKQAEREAFLKERRHHQLELRLEEARTDAYMDEIRAANVLQRLLDPDSANAVAAAEPSKFAATAQRTVSDAGLEGKRISKKDEDEESYFVGTGGKKGKKGKKGSKLPATADAPAAEKSDSAKIMGKFWSPSVIEQFSLCSIEPPSTPDEIPTVLQKVQEKKDFWLKDQKRKTQENIEKAQAAFEAEENQANDSATKEKGRKPAASKAATANEDGATAEVVEQLADASLAPAVDPKPANGANGEGAEEKAD